MAASTSSSLVATEAHPALQLPSDEGMCAIEAHRAKFYAKRRSPVSVEMEANDCASRADFAYSPRDSNSASSSGAGEERAYDPVLKDSGLAKWAKNEVNGNAVVEEVPAVPLQYRVLGSSDDYMAITAQIDGREWTGMLYCTDNNSTSMASAKSRLQQLCRNDVEDLPLDQWASMLVDRQLLPNRQRRHSIANWAKRRGRMVCYSCLCVVPEEKTMPFVCNCRERQRQRASRSRNLRPGVQQQLRQRTREVVVAKLESVASLPPWSVTTERTAAAPQPVLDKTLTPTGPSPSPTESAIPLPSSEPLETQQDQEEKTYGLLTTTEDELQLEPEPSVTVASDVLKSEVTLPFDNDAPPSSPQMKLPENRIVTRSASKRMSVALPVATAKSSRPVKSKAADRSVTELEPSSKKLKPGIAKQLKLKAIKLANRRTQREPPIAEDTLTRAAEIPQYVIRSSGEEAPLKITLLRLPSSSPSSLSPHFNPIAPSEPHQSVQNTVPDAISALLGHEGEVRKSPRKCTSQRMESIIASLKSRSRANPPRAYNPFGSAQAQKSSPKTKRRKSNSSEPLADKAVDSTPKTRSTRGDGIHVFDFPGDNSASNSSAPNSPLELATSPGETTHKHGFRVGDLVWARTPNLPYWPGQVSELVDEESLIVAWCGESTHNPVQVSTVDHFLPAFPQRFQPTSSSLKKKFCVAVAEALVLARADVVSLDGRLNWSVAQHLSQQHGWNLDGLRVYRGGGKKWTEFRAAGSDRGSVSSSTPTGSLR